MHLGVKCIPFGAAFHLGFGQCPAVGGRGVKHMDLFPNIPFPLPFFGFASPPRVHLYPHDFSCSFHIPRVLLGNTHAKVKTLFSLLPQTSTRQSDFKSDRVFLKSWTESPNILLRTGLIQSQILPQFSLPIVIYFRATERRKKDGERKQGNLKPHHP